MRLLVTRPEGEAEALAEALRAAGHEAIVEPMIEIRPVAGAMLPHEEIDALVVTSRNALRAIAGRTELPMLQTVPVYTVGAATAAVARQLGFKTVIEGEGAAVALLPVILSSISPGATLLHLAGDHLAGDLATPLSHAGIALRSAIVYESSARSALSPALVAAMRRGEIDGVILMSPRTARTFAQLVVQAHVTEEASRLVYFCISANAAQALGGLDPPAVRTAAKPDLPSLMALIDRERRNCPDGRERL